MRAAAQATTEGRMKMLAAAAAGVFTPDLDSEMRSRVSRAIMEFEPSDVLELRRLMEADQRSGGSYVAGRMRLEWEPLERAGCIKNATMLAGHGILVNDLGRMVLTALESWAPAES